MKKITHLILIFVLLYSTACKKEEDSETPTKKPDVEEVSENEEIVEEEISGVPKDNDGNVYDTIKIGTQFWMSENLKTTTYNDGSAIAYPGADVSSWENNTSGAYAWYNNDINYKDSIGALYNWDAASSGKLCPKGWRMPTKTDFETLITYLGGSAVAGEKMKDTLDDSWYKTTFSSNESGFTAVAAYRRVVNGEFDNGIKSHANFWTSTEGNSATSGFGLNLFWADKEATFVSYVKGVGMCVRCVLEN